MLIFPIISDETTNTFCLNFQVNYTLALLFYFGKGLEKEKSLPCCFAEIFQFTENIQNELLMQE